MCSGQRANNKDLKIHDLPELTNFAAKILLLHILPLKRVPSGPLSYNMYVMYSNKHTCNYTLTLIGRFP